MRVLLNSFTRLKNADPQTESVQSASVCGGSRGPAYAHRLGCWVYETAPRSNQSPNPRKRSQPTSPSCLKFSVNGKCSHCLGCLEVPGTNASLPSFLVHALVTGLPPLSDHLAHVTLNTTVVLLPCENTSILLTQSFKKQGTPKSSSTDAGAVQVLA